jgi:hypothetical protein
MTSATRGCQAEMGQKRHWAMGGPVDLFQIDGGSRPRRTRRHSPTDKTSEVWITPSTFLLRWADGLLGN